MQNEPHDGRHVGCQPCFAVKLRSIQFQGMGAAGRRDSEASRSRDMDEYQRLRRQGYQPQHVFGSAELATQAESKFEVEHSVVMAPAIRKEMESRMADLKEAT